jgi:hypothetical protein
MILTSDEIEKIRLLDKLLSSLSRCDLMTLVEEEQIIDKLRGISNQSPILENIVMDNQRLSNELSETQSELNVLRYDVQLLAKLILKPYDYDSTSNAQNLKSKYGIY